MQRVTRWLRSPSFSERLRPVSDIAKDKENRNNRAGNVPAPFLCFWRPSAHFDGQRKNLWYWTLGPEYVELAFTYARKYADPDVKLFYNDFSTVDPKKRECIFELCQNLAAKGLIDGIGMQGYWDVKNPSLKTIKDTIERFAETGQVGFIATKRVDAKLILPEAIKVLQQKGTAAE